MKLFTRYHVYTLWIFSLLLLDLYIKSEIQNILLWTALKQMQYIHSKHERQSTVWQFKTILIIICLNKES